jgi:hypothetical protein
MGIMLKPYIGRGFLKNSWLTINHLIEKKFPNRSAHSVYADFEAIFFHCL